ncbi:amino acid ABC transporter substrate-binding protein [Actinospica sp.]|uniref:amino acid ABC transporter substrate-binding protein n=1 Tax=Actinospica sp. TaxID=1872142 RepID=UPI002CC2CD8E|nr:amino acid ABC transporter substrate-binding protein [Actinospica sp.]HWG27463.1 amino acid ABC transporter substrate-binding protein [Actinospica sp.]
MRSTVRRSAWAVPVCLAALAAGACSASPASSQGGGANSSPLVVGVSMSLSGDLADLAGPAEKGYQLWADTVNAQGGLLGRKVSLKIVDDASSPTQVVTNYENLITADHVNLVFGPFSSLLTIPAASIAKRYGYAFIEPSGGAPQVFDLHMNNLFLAQPAPIVSSGDAFAGYILSLPADQRPKTAAYPSADDPFTSAIVARIQQRLQAAGIKTVYSQTYAAETVDLSPVVTRLVSAKPDLIVSGTGGADAVAEVKGMVQAHWTPKYVFFTGGPNDPTFPASVGAGNVNGIFGASDWVPQAKTTGNAAFIKAYIAKYGGTAAGIDPAAAEAYACGQLLQLVAQRTGKIDNATIISALHSGSWPTVEGDLTWDANGTPQGADSVVQWIQGQLLPVYPPSQALASPIAKPYWAG